MKSKQTNTDLFLIRHGQPELQNTLLGSTDSPLSQYGWSQLEKIIEQLNDIDFLISSPLSRCAEFAQQYADKKQQELVINENWRECHFGDWDGTDYQSLYQQFPLAVEAFYNDPYKNMPANSEALGNFCDRIENALFQLLKKEQGKKIAIFTHAGVIRTLVAWCLKINYESGVQFQRFAVDYASITHISIYHAESSSLHNDEGKSSLFPQLVSLNQTHCL
ncbi:MAG: histidine phosphatase family protein [gamma proteobacterium symbiont of Taylorina sp.]|nr:histidine phosphatase family protein [gamma proteobacterium symbiont of Taylorina sp.]